ncbi:ATP-binding protein [Dialister sp. i34-0019-2H8]|uniref:ATP-binding protein n=1 Tax=Dialister sp. i34-0019-2H8 TaxID=3141190 RepID=UPI0034A77D1A
MEFKRQKYMDALVERMHNGMIKVVTGIRRSGKSYLLFNLFVRYLMQQGTAMDHILTMQLDRWDMRRYRDPDMLLSWIHERMTDEGDYYILLDEVQFLDHFEEVLNSLLYESHVDVYVTGSNSKFLSNDILTAFRGRGDEIHVYPLVFSEFMEQYDGDMYHGWADYATYGGLPQVASMKTEQQKITYLQSLFKETYLKDILERHKLKYPEGMEDLVNVLASSIGTLMNPTKILATFQSRFHSKLSLNTIRQYIDFLEEAFLIQKAVRYDVKGRKYIDTPVKYYFEDVGLRNARLDFRQVEETHLMENIIYNELRCRGYLVDVGVVNRRILDEESGRMLSRQLEVDFIASLGNKRYYIQSAFHLPDEEKLRQEKASLLALSDGFKKIILVKDVMRPRRGDDGILIMSVFDFLLYPHGLDEVFA